jgi:hypothetical protein
MSPFPNCRFHDVGNLFAFLNVLTRKHDTVFWGEEGSVVLVIVFIQFKSYGVRFSQAVERHFCNIYTQTTLNWLFNTQHSNSGYLRFTSWVAVFVVQQFKGYCKVPTRIQCIKNKSIRCMHAIIKKMDWLPINMLLHSPSVKYFD